MTARPPFEIVYGVVGTKACGKQVFVDHGATQGFSGYTLSAPLKVMFQERHGRADWQTEDLMDLGDELRRKHGPGHLAGETLMLASQAGHRRVVIDGLRNPGEVERLRQLAGANLVLVGITAPLMTRWERVQKRAKKGDPTTIEGFLAMDDKDRGIGQSADGQQVDRTLAMVPHENVFVNDGTLAAFQDWIDRRIKMDIVSLVIHAPHRRA
jgi:dephospho-CoA kinase